MKVNYFSITLWFNIFEEHANIIEKLGDLFKSEYSQINFHMPEGDNLLEPVLNAVNNEKKTNFHMSKISTQYNMDDVTLEDLEIFKEKSLKLFNFLEDNNIEVKYSAIVVGLDKEVDDSTIAIAQNILNSSLQENIADVNLKLGFKHEDLFYKIINLVNNKEIKLKPAYDDAGKPIPVPLISWNGNLILRNSIFINYEINDRYSFDFTKNYHTTEFYLNKMFFTLKEDLEDDINNLLEKGNIN